METLHSSGRSLTDTVNTTIEQSLLIYLEEYLCYMFMKTNREVFK